MKTFSTFLVAVMTVSVCVEAYKNFYMPLQNNSKGSPCSVIREKLRLRLISPNTHFRGLSTLPKDKLSHDTLPLTTTIYVDNTVKPPYNGPVIDPLDIFADIVNDLLYGKAEDKDGLKQNKKNKLEKEISENEDEDLLQYCPTGSIMRSDLFAGHVAVHMPFASAYYQGHVNLCLTSDYMQTAVDAFFFFHYASLDDVLRLPAEYVLKSARTIAMLTLDLEKMSATWEVVKGDREPAEVPYQVLELYRPLFKYLSPLEMASLNLTDERILTYIGTHPDLGRHHVGAVASKYMKLNPRWGEAHYLNLLNNVMCGIPITKMRKLAESAYLQINHQAFFHIRACDPLQRRFFLNMMTQTTVLGKSYSWTARDVTRLGLLVSHMKGKEISSISPQAMAGLTAQVIQDMSPEKLKYITERQMQHMEGKSFSLLARKMGAYRENLYDKSMRFSSHVVLIIILLALAALVV